MFKSKTLIYRYLHVIAFCLIALTGRSNVAHSAAVNYTYAGAQDFGCLVEGIGTASCSIAGVFALDDALFGTQQQTLSGAMTLSINGNSVFTQILFPDPLIGQLGECTEVCNQVTTDSLGNVITFYFFAVPSFTFGDIVSFSHDGWSWDGFVDGQFGIDAGASGATIALVPLPASFLLYLFGLFGLGAASRWKHTKTAVSLKFMKLRENTAKYIQNAKSATFNRVILEG